jgi:exosortase
MKQAMFPAFFLLFMVPMPDQMVHVLETGSQHASAEATNLLLKFTSMPSLRDPDNSMIFHFPGISLRVAEECSGIRSSWVLLITGLVAANIFLKSNWRRILFVALVIPLGIVRNGFRIASLGWLCVNVNPDMIDHWIHHRGGPVFFALSLIPLFLILLLLRRGETRAERKRLAGKKAEVEALAGTV